MRGNRNPVVFCVYILKFVGEDDELYLSFCSLLPEVIYNMRGNTAFYIPVYLNNIFVER